ncbi:hypothetical protein AMATHDRAFT_1080 [Amanita thiersii Skay4041]|uniref:Uncharacterized protein n=1 Tax=Amanita thiersii Skay4041 TaxID=703135 RepID=A0A2A9NUS4_9AGAR|nr:hypothetical protein AMATHDRAFT_1080 [Amanita thiersii Skay4041]
MAEPSVGVLGSVTGLFDGYHMAVFTSQSDDPVDFDNAIIETSRGSTKEISVESDIMYYGLWVTGDSIKYSDYPDASASLAFVGEMVEVYGTVSPDFSPPQFSLDGVQHKPANEPHYNISEPSTNVLLFYASGLEPVERNLILARAPGTQNHTSFSSIRVFQSFSTSTTSIPVITSTQLPSTASPSAITNDGTTKPSHRHVIIGVVVGSVLGMLLLLTALMLLWLRKQRLRRSKTRIETPMSPDLPLQRDPSMVSRNSIKDGGDQVTQQPTPQSYYYYAEPLSVTRVQDIPQLKMAKRPAQVITGEWI